MLRADAIKYFGTQASVARAIGLTRVSVNSWSKVIPYDKARALEIVTGGRLRIDETLYPVLKVAREIAAKSA